MLFTHKLHMGEGAGQTSAGHRAPNTDVRADSHAEDRMRRRTANPAPALTAIDRASNRPYMGDLRHRGCYSGPAN